MALGALRGAVDHCADERCDRDAVRRHDQAEPLRAAGEYGAYVAAMTDALAKRPDHPATLYNAACAEALAGRADDAIEHLRLALELKPEWAEMAREDDDLASLRDRPGWPASSA